MSPVERAWRTVQRPAVVLAALEERLASRGAVVELRQLQGLSASETDVLLYREVHGA